MEIYAILEFRHSNTLEYAYPTYIRHYLKPDSAKAECIKLNRELNEWKKNNEIAVKILLDDKYFKEKFGPEPIVPIAADYRTIEPKPVPMKYKPGSLPRRMKEWCARELTHTNKWVEEVQKPAIKLYNEYLSKVAAERDRLCLEQTGSEYGDFTWGGIGFIKYSSVKKYEVKTIKVIEE